MSDQHTFIVLDTEGQLKVIEKALEDFTRPFRVIHRKTPKATFRFTKVNGVRMRQLVYEGEDVTIELPGIPTPITRERCIEVLKAILFEFLSQAVNYMDTQSWSKGIACGMFDAVSPSPEQLDAVELFVCHPRIDGLINDAMCTMAVVRESPWREWQLVESRGFFALLGGRDYRIEEWERMNPQYGQSSELYQFDMNSLLNYVGSQYSKSNYSNMVSDPHITKFIVSSVLSELLPNVSIKQRSCPSFGFMNYPQFIATIVKPAVRMFILNSMKGLLSVDGGNAYHIHYSGELLDNGVLLLDREETPDDVEELERLSVMEAINNQDYVPERIRRKYAL